MGESHGVLQQLRAAQRERLSAVDVASGEEVSKQLTRLANLSTDLLTERGFDAAPYKGLLNPSGTVSRYIVTLALAANDWVGETTDTVAETAVDVLLALCGVAFAIDRSDSDGNREARLILSAIFLGQAEFCLLGAMGGIFTKAAERDIRSAQAARHGEVGGRQRSHDANLFYGPIVAAFVRAKQSGSRLSLTAWCERRAKDFYDEEGRTRSPTALRKELGKRLKIIGQKPGFDQSK